MLREARDFKQGVREAQPTGHAILFDYTLQRGGKENNGTHIALSAAEKEVRPHCTSRFFINHYSTNRTRRTKDHAPDPLLGVARSHAHSAC